jgi:hypothetical protein
MTLSQFKTLKAGDRIKVRNLERQTIDVATVTDVPYDGGTMVSVMFDTPPSDKPWNKHARKFGVYFRDVMGLER